MSTRQLEIISDTHGKHEFMQLKGADILIHCGDFSDGSRESILGFFAWFSQQSHLHKVLIAGNHEMWLETVIQEGVLKNGLRELIYETYKIIYLHEESVTIGGVNFYGSPYSVMFYNWAFMESERELFERYKNIPDDTHVLLTHTPPKGILDKNFQGDNSGSKALGERIKALKRLRLHCFGHIHESYGREDIEGSVINSVSAHS